MQGVKNMIVFAGENRTTPEGIIFMADEMARECNARKERAD
jgi:hypothetical protein